MSAIDTIFQTFDTLGLILMYGWPFILLFIIFIMRLRMKNWGLEAVIVEKRGENLIKTNDRARKYTDEAGLVKYQLLKCKDTFPVYNYDWVMHNVFVPTTFSEKMVNILRGNVGTIFLFRYGSKQYKPIRMGQKEGSLKLVEVKTKKGGIKYENRYIPFDPRDKLGAVELEVLDWDNMNFMVQEQRSAIERRKNKIDKLMQIIVPATILAVTAMVCIFMLYYSYEYATGMRTSAPAQPEPATVPNVPIISGVMPGQ